MPVRGPKNKYFVSLALFSPLGLSISRLVLLCTNNAGRHRAIKSSMSLVNDVGSCNGGRSPYVLPVL